ncbi:Uncharacterised protein [BD1-7 clade bacterium]|uniref:Uncharacterized protein n=1 Tax=BD1-7 clade bacterium TaxID=2029982 RepID=A0A5S9PR66_9GAMM|nr:Uncharacterised protein [BD1-7 clade bacterium]
MLSEMWLRLHGSNAVICVVWADLWISRVAQSGFLNTVINENAKERAAEAVSLFENVETTD